MLIELLLNEQYTDKQNQLIIDSFNQAFFQASTQKDLYQHKHRILNQGQKNENTNKVAFNYFT